MFYSSIKIALRNLYREKLYAAINIAGLSLAITCCLILGLYLRQELTYDQHFDNHENIYRVVNTFTTNGNSAAFAATSRALGKLMAADFDDIQDYVSMEPVQTPIFVRSDTFSQFWSDTYIVTPNFFKVFNHDTIYGDPNRVLQDTKSVAISETFAHAYFGDANPIGKTLHNELGDPFSVGLVFADVPENSHLKYDLLLSYNRFNLPDDVSILDRMLGSVDDYTYLVMADGFDPDNFAAMGETFFQRHMAEQAKEIGHDSFVTFGFEPLADIHYHSGMPYDAPQGNPAYLYAFGLVALFILIVASINYTNLATARSIRRSKEVGLRKILGASKNTLLLQFMVEAILYSCISTLIAIVLLEIALDTSWATELLGKPISFSLFAEPQLLLWLALFTLGLGLLAGVYPAVYLSSWAPLSAMVSSGKNAGKGNIKLRQALVLFQFAISIAVIAATSLMSNQMRFLTEKSLGFDKENLVAIHMIGADLVEKSDTIKTELIQNPYILGVTVSMYLLGNNLNLNGLQIENNDGEDIPVSLTNTLVDLDYLKVLGMELVEGRDFSQHLLTDADTSVIVNEAMVQSQGWNEPIGKRVHNGSVIGVVKDFNFQSLHNQIQPLALFPLNDDFTNLSDISRRRVSRYMTVRIAAGHTREAIDYLRDRFAEYDPVHNVKFEFVDGHLNQLYQSDNSLMRLVGIFSGICIFIAALGLFGLASFTTEQRSKEIAIRKVLGASTGQIILMLSKSVLGLVLVGAVIASAIAYWAINEWLTSFAYRTNISTWTFIIAALAAFVVAFVTMALQSYRTAQSDPVDALRIE